MCTYIGYSPRKKAAQWAIEVGQEQEKE
jgi:hypothetical protein